MVILSVHSLSNPLSVSDLVVISQIKKKKGKLCIRYQIEMTFIHWYHLLMLKCWFMVDMQRIICWLNNLAPFRYPAQKMKNKSNSFVEYFHLVIVINKIKFRSVSCSTIANFDKNFQQKVFLKLVNLVVFVNYPC